MKRFVAAFLVMLVSAGVVLADPAVTVPPEVHCKPGRMARIPVTTTGKNLQVVNFYEDVADLFREYDPDPTHFTYRFVSDTTGSYKLGFYTALGDVPSPPAYCTVVVDGPPAPPPPPPPPPPPTDPLAATLAAAYAKDQDANKADQVQFLAKLFSSSDGILTDDVKTVQNLFDKLHAAIRAPVVGIPKGKMVNTLAAVEDELQAKLGTDPTATINSIQVKAEFQHIAAALGGLK
jgi:hypothetical protein